MAGQTGQYHLATILQGIQAAVSPDTTVIYDKFGRFEDVPADQTAVCVPSMANNLTPRAG
ncbi:MAG: hypothetical protein IPM76_27800 [Chloroflexi bacterium]|nr:hypothetical protein [Chloroflexota bacterium]